jgi:1-pyrroline-5-carboxylate dehydrogenase
VSNNGFQKEMGRYVSNERTKSVLKPYGVWAVIAPFNFPFALTGGPTGAALVAGNTVVIKPATDTAWIVRLYAECLRDAGFPEGVVNFVTGPGSTLGQALVDNQDVDGATFTGSFDVGMKLYRDFANRNYVRPVVLELGGKNPAIVSRNATWNAPQSASSARRLVCKGRSVRQPRVLSSRSRFIMTCWVV